MLAYMGSKLFWLKHAKSVYMLAVQSTFAIQQRLRRHAPELSPGPVHPRSACVALVLAGPPEDASLCLIRRAERVGDRWSGHMALPGGRIEPEDPTLQLTAVRETHEEVGLDLSSAQYYGALSQLQIHRGGEATDAVLAPFVFYAGERIPELIPEPSEVAAAMWVKLRHLWDRGNHTVMMWTGKEAASARPGIRVGDRVVWGLTWRVLASFGNAVGVPLQSGLSVSSTGSSVSAASSQILP
ncbi:MAG: 8-oxo-dGTP pyrophosphatase MutT (NUDIX family) [Myxococcota bacterium]|jgi:8-oxo-dGTP pyrophosphatase MutT (NUDIX family)